MTANFPTSLDTLTDPTASDKLNSGSVPHASQHADLNNIVEALEAKVGVNSSAVATSHDYKIAQLEAGATANAIKAYANSSARTSAVPSPSEGDLSYLQDTNAVEVYDGSAWVELGATKVKKVERFTSSTSWTVPTGVTFVIAEARGGGGGCSNSATNAGTGGTSSFGAIVSAVGGRGTNIGFTGGTATTQAAQNNSGQGGFVASVNGDKTTAAFGYEGVTARDGGTVTPGASITVTVGGGGTGDGAGGTGYVWVEYYEDA